MFYMTTIGMVNADNLEETKVVTSREQVKRILRSFMMRDEEGMFVCFVCKDEDSLSDLIKTDCIIRNQLFENEDEGEEDE